LRSAAVSLVLLSAGAAVAAGRVDEVARMLPPRPAGLGRPITDRAAWSALSGHPYLRSMTATAERLAGEEIPGLPDDLYLDFSRTGNRSRWQVVDQKRQGRLRPFTLAECVADQGRFLEPLEATIQALCAEPTWVMPAHDRSLKNFRGATIDIDLGSSHLAWELATVDYLLGDRLSPEVRSLIRREVRRRVLDPFLAMVAGERARNWWMDTTNNWNAVCLAGVAGAALALVEDPKERARFVVAAEQYIENFLKGFGVDGYCTEGLGYWNYGFGRFVYLAETLARATGGGVDLFDREEVRAPALFGVRTEILDGVYPAFADCRVDQQPSPGLMAYVNRRLQLGLPGVPETRIGGGLIEALLHAFPRPVASGVAVNAVAAETPLRTWFDASGILISRPAPGSSSRMGVALKGGHNNEHHNHNDVGSYVVVANGRPVLVDPGLETYTARTFSKQRYDSKVLNSFGHPVPVIAGQLQRTGQDARGEVVSTLFSDVSDTLVIDLRSAYPVEALTHLTRTFVYDRTGPGALRVTDEVAFSDPRTFGTALVTLGDWERRSADTLVVRDGDAAVLVRIHTGGLGFEVRSEQIDEDVKTDRLPTRIAIDLQEPLLAATVTLSIVPGN
jgi:hypothetical protein